MLVYKTKECEKYFCKVRRQNSISYATKYEMLHLQQPTHTHIHSQTQRGNSARKTR